MEEEFLIERSIRPDQLDWPPESNLATGDYFARGYRDLRGVNWGDASDSLEMEREILARVAGDLSVAEEAMCDEELFRLGGLDLGVAAAVVALSAANCAPIASCNGGAGHHEAYPCIAFYCRENRLPDLLKAAELAGCGLESSGDGSVVLYANSVVPLLLFAEMLIEMRDQLKPL